MGFTSAFYKFNKFMPDLTDQENFDIYRLVEKYLQAKKYNLEFEEDLSKFNLYRLPQVFDNNEQILEYLTSQVTTKNPNILEPIELEYWCSNGQIFHSDLMNLVEGTNSEIRLISKEDIKKLLNYAFEKLESYQIENVCPTRSFKCKLDEDGEDITLYKEIDGIEVVFEDGSKKDLYSEDSEIDSLLFTSKKYLDLSGLFAIYNLIKCLSTIASTTNWNNEIVYYCGGW